MEDAYEIGIRLVLENGVSAGVAALQRDLATYDLALAATSVRLRTVSEAGRGLKAPVGGRASDPPARSRGTREDAEALDAAPRHRQQISGLVSAAVRSATAVPAPARNLPAASATAPASPLPAVVVPAPAKPPQPAPVAVPSVPRVTLAGPASVPPQGALRPPSAPVQPVLAAGAVARRATPPSGRKPATASVTPTAALPLPYARYAPASVAGQPTTAIAASDVVAGGPVSMPAPDQPADRRALLAGRELFHASGWTATPSRAESAQSAIMQALPRRASGLGVAATPAAPVAAAAPSGPVQGDVYLDGARVGRWMSDRLAREADRPQGGVTSFDPRLGPAWPGSLHGT